MSDNSLMGNSTDLIRDIDRSGVKTQVVQLDGGGTAGESLVSVVNGLPVSLNQIYYPSSTNNSSAAQLAAGATFTGVVETILSLQAAQIEIVCDRPYSLTINQYIDAAGLKLSSFITFNQLANQSFCQNITLPGNYFNIVVKNNGASATTTLEINTTFGIMDTSPSSLTTLGNFRGAIVEVGNNAIANNSGVPVSNSADKVSLNVEDPSIALLRRIVKLLEGQSAQDNAQRARIVVDGGTLPTVGTVTTVGTVSSITGGTITTITNAVPVGNIATVAGVDHRQFADIARIAYNTGLRSKLN